MSTKSTLRKERLHWRAQAQARHVELQELAGAVKRLTEENTRLQTQVASLRTESMTRAARVLVLEQRLDQCEGRLCRARAQADPPSVRPGCGSCVFCLQQRVAELMAIIPQTLVDTYVSDGAQSVGTLPGRRLTVPQKGEHSGT